MRPVKLDAASPGEFPGLEAFFAENRTSLCWLEGDRGLLAASRASRDGFHSLASDGARRTAGPLSFARFTTLRFVLEVLVGEKLLLSRRPDELRAAVNALKDPILELHRSLPRRVGRRHFRASLFELAPELLAVALSRQGLFCPALITWFQVEGMLLDVLDDVFLLDLPFEPAEGTFDRLALLDFYFSHVTHTPFGWLVSNVLG
jgi:hypothetical protein